MNKNIDYIHNTIRDKNEDESNGNESSGQVFAFSNSLVVKTTT